MQEAWIVEQDDVIGKSFLRLEQRRQEILRRLHVLGRKQEGVWREKGFTLRAKSLRELRMAAIMDMFTLACFQPECRIFELTPSGWRQEIEEAQPDVFFLESAWRGKGMLWKDRMIGYPPELYAIADYCHERHIPVVFWCKEDPIHTDGFMHIAHLADVVFTTDIDAVELYKRELGHDFVYPLHFAAQPRLHNPLERYERKDRFFFAGSYPRRFADRCRLFDELSETFLRLRGMDIYDRSYLDPVPTAMFPEIYRPYILGGLRADEIDIAYKGYLYGINMNSVRESRTMFARRVFELMASNTVVVSNWSRGLENYFGDLAIATDDSKEMEKIFRERCGSREAIDKLRLAALRKVLLEHLYEDRLDFIVRKVFGRSLKQELPKILVCSRVDSREEADRVLGMFRRQSFFGKKLVLVSEREDLCDEIPTISLALLRESLPELWEGAEYLAWFHPMDWYGANYLLDMVLSTRYGDFDVIGKAEHYEKAEGRAVRCSEGQAYRFQESLPARRSMARMDLLKEKDISPNAEYRTGKILAIDAFNYCEDWQEEECPEAAEGAFPNQGISLGNLEEAASLVTPMARKFPAMVLSASEIAKAKLPEEHFSLRVEKEEVLLESRVPETWKEWYPMGDPTPIGMHLDENGKLPMEILGTSSFKLQFRCVFYDSRGKVLARKGVRQGKRERVETHPFAEKMQLEISPRGTGTAILCQITIGENGFRMGQCCFLEENVKRKQKADQE